MATASNTQKRPRQDNTTVASDHIDHFGSGQINSRFYGKSLTKEFQQGVRVLENMDITDQGALVKRKGLVQDKRFVFNKVFRRNGHNDDGLGAEFDYTVISNLEIDHLNYRVFSDVVVYSLAVRSQVQLAGASTRIGTYSGIIVGGISREDYDAYGNNEGLFNFDPDVPHGTTLNNIGLDPATVYNNYSKCVSLSESRDEAPEFYRGRLVPPYLPMINQSKSRNFSVFSSTTQGIGRSVIEKVGNTRYIVMFPEYPGGLVPFIVETGSTEGVFNTRFMGDIGKVLDIFGFQLPMQLRFSELGLHPIQKSKAILNVLHGNTSPTQQDGAKTVFFSRIGVGSIFGFLSRDSTDTANKAKAERLNYGNYLESQTETVRDTYGYVTFRGNVFSGNLPQVEEGEPLDPDATYRYPNGDEVKNRFRTVEDVSTNDPTKLTVGGVVINSFSSLGGLPEFFEVEWRQWSKIGEERVLSAPQSRDILTYVGDNPFTVNNSGEPSLVTTGDQSGGSNYLFKPNIQPSAYFSQPIEGPRDLGVNVNFLGVKSDSSLSDSQNTLFMLANVDEEVLSRCLLNENQPGIILIDTGEIDPSGDKPVLSERVVVAFVHPIKFLRVSVGFDQDIGFNCYLQFFTNAALAEGGNFLKAIKFVTQEGAEVLTTVRDGLGFTDAKRMRRTLKVAPSFSVVYLPMFNSGDGFPSTVATVDQRTVFSGFKTNRVAFSYRRSALGFSPIFPPQIDPGLGVIDSIRAKNENVILGKDKDLSEQGKAVAIGFRPLDDTDDYVQFYANATAPIYQAMVEDLSLSSNESIKWVTSHRDIMIGTNRQEFFVTTPNRGPLTVDTIASRNFQSARGSGLGITAKGDYNFYFVGADRRTIYSAAFSESIGGMRSMNATYIGGPDIGEVSDMVWDTKRNALWVLYQVEGISRIALFYNSTEYGVMGWSYYSFGDHERFNNILNFVSVEDDIGFLLQDGDDFRVFIAPYDTLFYRDEGDEPIRSRVTFFRVPIRGAKGNPSLWTKIVGKTTLFCQNVTELVYNKDTRIVYSPDAANVEGVNMIECGGQVRGSRLPYLEVQHNKDEPAAFLAISSRYEILEE